MSNDDESKAPSFTPQSGKEQMTRTDSVYSNIIIQRRVTTVQWLQLSSRQNIPSPNTRHTDVTRLLENGRSRASSCLNSDNQIGKAALVVSIRPQRLPLPTARPLLGAGGPGRPHFESWSFVSSKRAERIPSFFSSSTRSPFWCICRRMSQPPTNSPLRYTCGMVGQLE